MRPHLLVTLLLCGGCEALVPSAPGDDDGAPPVELPPPAAHFGIVTSPRTGDTAVTEVRGAYTDAGAAITIEVEAPDGTWATVATGTTAATASPGADGDPRFGFDIPLDPSSYWPRGGLLHLRARAGEDELVGFFADADDCLARWDTLREGAQHCGSVYTRAGIVLVSTDVDLDRADDLGTYLDDKGAIDPTETAAYYAAIDAPATVADFRARYLVSGELTAAYYNEGDLATGREMHCGSFDGGVACYVHNYGLFGSTRDDAEAALTAGVASGTGAGAFATVAMVQRAGAVDFIVYGPDQSLSTQAILDTHGDNASIPNNCINCHGSQATYDATTHTLSGARFLPFDPASFHFAPGLPRTDQEDALRAMNALVASTKPGYAAGELIAGMYGGHVADPGRIADTGWTPPAWTGESASHVYREVVAPYCRGCHASREGTDGGADTWDFVDQTRFVNDASKIAAVVCARGDDKVHRMPSAEATARRFWSGPARAYLAAITGYPGVCTP